MNFGYGGGGAQNEAFTFKPSASTQASALGPMGGNQLDEYGNLIPVMDASWGQLAPQPKSPDAVRWGQTPGWASMPTIPRR